MRVVAVLLLAGCGGGAWKPRVWNDTPADPESLPVAIAFPDGTNGTALVLKLLGDAKAAEVGGISQLEIQVGRCTRTIAVAPRETKTAGDPDLDRVTAHLVEKKLSCGRTVDQNIKHAPLEGRPTFGETEVVVRDACTLDDVEVVAVRYRFEIDHAFTPPDWDAIEKWGRVRLAASAPRCGTVAKNQLRARFHHREWGPNPSWSYVPSPSNASRIVDLVALAMTAAEAKHGEESTRLAQQAIDELSERDPFVGADATIRAQLGTSIALAYVLVVEEDAQRFLQRTPPPSGPLGMWASEVGGEIDRIARRYEHVKDVVRVDQVGTALQFGAARLAAMHEHLATLLDAIDQKPAAVVERATARELRGR